MDPSAENLTRIGLIRFLSCGSRYPMPRRGCFVANHSLALVTRIIQKIKSISRCSGQLITSII
jgi:hypothetical protein